jgi:hypothetical protein
VAEGIDQLDDARRSVLRQVQGEHDITALSLRGGQNVPHSSEGRVWRV